MSASITNQFARPERLFIVGLECVYDLTYNCPLIWIPSRQLGFVHRFLGSVDKIGTAYTESAVASGYGSYIALVSRRNLT